MAVVLGICALWYGVTTSVYKFLQPSLTQDNLSALARGKHLEYFLMLSSGLITWLAIGSVRHLTNSQTTSFAGPAVLMLGITGALWTAYSHWILSSAMLIIIFAIAIPLALNPHGQEVDSKKRRVIFCVFYGVLALALVFRVSQTHFKPTLNLFEDGPRLASVGAFLDGKVPFREFVVHYGVLQEVAKPLLAFRIWNETYEAYLRMGAWLSGLTGALIVVLLAQTLRHRWWGLAVGLILLARQDIHVPDRLFFPALTLVLYIRGMSTNQLAWSAAAGISLLASLLYSLDVALPLTAAFLIYAWTGYDKRWRSMAWGFVGTAGVFVVVLLLQGSLFPFITMNIAWLTHFGGTWSDGLPSHFFAYRFLSKPQPWWIYVYIHQIPILCVFASAYLFGPARCNELSWRWKASVLFVYVAFFQFFIYIGRSDYTHWLNATPLTWILSAMMIENLLIAAQSSTKELHRRWISTFVVSVLAVPYVSMVLGLHSLTIPRFLIGKGKGDLASHVADSKFKRLGNLPLTREESRELSETIGLIQSHVSPTETWFDLSNHGSLYFLANRRNATSFGMLSEVQGPRLTRRCLQELASAPPKAVLVRYDGETLDCWPNGKLICEYILKHYDESERSLSGEWRLLTAKK